MAHPAAAVGRADPQAQTARVGGPTRGDRLAGPLGFGQRHAAGGRDAPLVGSVGEGVAGADQGRGHGVVQGDACAAAMVATVDGGGVEQEHGQ